MNRDGIFGQLSCKEKRIIGSLEEMEKLVASLRVLGLKIVLTNGTYDMAHVGHFRYLEEARKHGDLLIVGIDSDEKTRDRKKNDYRPVVPEDERAEVLCHSRAVDVVIIKQLGWQKHILMKTVRPDVLICVEETYPAGIPNEISESCGKVVILPRQAETSTSAKIRRLLIGGFEEFKEVASSRLPDFIETCRKAVLENK